jgi:hypothetical protein
MSSNRYEKTFVRELRDGIYKIKITLIEEKYICFINEFKEKIYCSKPNRVAWKTIKVGDVLTMEVIRPTKENKAKHSYIEIKGMDNSIIKHEPTHHSDSIYQYFEIEDFPYDIAKIRIKGYTKGSVSFKVLDKIGGHYKIPRARRFSWHNIYIAEEMTIVRMKDNNESNGKLYFNIEGKDNRLLKIVNQENANKEVNAKLKKMDEKELVKVLSIAAKKNETL